MPVATYINAIGTALPPNECHQLFIDWAAHRPGDDRQRRLFARMAARAGIERRWTVLPPSAFRSGDFYGAPTPPSTARRMAIYAEEAPRLALAAIGELGDLGDITHIVVASCTGFVAPGIDQIIARTLGLSDTVERTLIGFMGCYAAVTALRNAHHIVRSQPHARVLVVTVELCTLHLQDDDEVESLLAMLLFGDGAAAAVVSADPRGLELRDPFSLALADSGEMITWRIGDAGFQMVLSGAVPGRISEALAQSDTRRRLGGDGSDNRVDSWAVHAGGRSILDAVERGLAIAPEYIAPSRAVLRDNGNMSSATLMFVLSRILAGDAPIANGRAIAFGPGLAAEGFGYARA